MRMNCGIVAPFIAVRYDFTTPFTMEGTGTKGLMLIIHTRFQSQRHSSGKQHCVSAYSKAITMSTGRGLANKDPDTGPITGNGRASALLHGVYNQPTRVQYVCARAMTIKLW